MTSAGDQPAGAGRERVADPAFARTAAELLERGEAQEALRLCAEGLERYPWYATGNLLLARCHEELGRHGEALVEYRRALASLPENRMLQGAVRRVEGRQREQFREFAEEQVRMLGPVVNTRTFEEYLRAGEGESAVEVLLQKPKPPAAEPAELRTSAGEGVSPPEIVTVTLAEIYASQGQFNEAIEAYRKLVERRPEEAERFRKRIAELEDLQAAADAEKPLQE